ncbi:MAG TPA: hypothetical protein PKC28_15230 [Bdellovibrionales bacterium]|nr:hypothetical protein [Bdellovibrionales bacterium]
MGAKALIEESPKFIILIILKEKRFKLATDLGRFDSPHEADLAAKAFAQQTKSLDFVGWEIIFEDRVGEILTYDYPKATQDLRELRESIKVVSAIGLVGTILYWLFV